MMTFKRLDNYLAIVLITLTSTVSIPLTIKVIQAGSGPWGFGVVGLHILIPFSAYIVFSIAALLKDEKRQFSVFIAAHLITLYLALICFYVFPVLDKSILWLPVILALFGIFDKRNLFLHLLIMISLGIIANVLLLKWEFDFNRTVPLLQLFNSTNGY